MKKYLFLPLAFALLTCGDVSVSDEWASDLVNDLRTGWLASEEDLSSIPQDISSFNGNTSNLPTSYSLENKFPPIGDQEKYGTCVAWAVGYNLKTTLNGIEKNWSSLDLLKAANQTSPKDLWMVIPSEKKGADCRGTSFEPSFDALISSGAKSLSEVPYSNMGSCSGSSNGTANNKLANYRKIAYNKALYGNSGSEGMTLENFKGYISQGRPVVIGAKVGDRFMRWNSNAVLSSDTYNDPNRQNSYHAMVISGYDDSKEAFRVRNSWGTKWGNNGSIWVEYDFFLNNFCFAAFVAQNPNQSENSNNNSASSYDLLASFAYDEQDPESTNQRDRIFYYDIYNNGSSPILASQKWTVVYMYYNAYNANDYKIIFEDYYTDEYGSYGQSGEYTASEALAGGIWNYVDVEPGKKVGEAEFGSEGFYIPYQMPSITGDYYLVVYANAYDKIEETNEDNNFYFITAADGKPLKFTNGVMQSIIAKPLANILGKKQAKTAPAASVAELGELNGYTPQEIKSLLKRDKQSGVLAKKAMEYRENKTIPVKIHRKR